MHKDRGEILSKGYYNFAGLYHLSNKVEVDVELTEPSQEREHLRCMSKTSTLR
ncbi:unnamed protein product [Prunus armeniaca]